MDMIDVQPRLLADPRPARYVRALTLSCISTMCMYVAMFNRANKLSYTSYVYVFFRVSCVLYDPTKIW